MSDFQISIHHPDFPNDTEFEVEGVGLVKNGGSLTVTEEMQARYKADRGVDLKDSLEESPIIGVGKAKANVTTGKRTPNEQRSDDMMQQVGEVAVPGTAAEVDPAGVDHVSKEGGES